MSLQTRSDKLSKLPTYLFAELDKKKRELMANGVDVINLGIGDPDLAPPPRMIDALKEAVAVGEYHRYPAYEGAEFFRNTISKWLKERHNVTADPDTEILVLIGSKEGLSHFPHAVLNPGDQAIITDPCYPPHLQSMILAGVGTIRLPLIEENGFLPDLDSVSKKNWERSKMIVLNYPNNPTSAPATEDFFKKLIELAHKHGFIICHDSPYIDICMDGKRQISLMSLEGAKEVAVEFFTVSKMFNICGWRIGFCVGNKDLIASLGKYKTAVDSGQFTALQKAVDVGLRECMINLDQTLKQYKERREILCEGLENMGLSYFKSNHTLYVWMRVPKKFTSREYANILLENAGIVVTPGIGFGSLGDNYIRFSLTSSIDRIAEATRRMKEIA